MSLWSKVALPYYYLPTAELLLISWSSIQMISSTFKFLQQPVGKLCTSLTAMLHACLRNSWMSSTGGKKLKGDVTMAEKRITLSIRVMESAYNCSWLKGIKLYVSVRLDSSFLYQVEHMRNLLCIAMVHKVKHQLRCPHPRRRRWEACSGGFWTNTPGHVYHMTACCCMNVGGRCLSKS